MTTTNIKKAHDKYPDTDLDIDEVSLLHTDVYNPALTRAAKTNFLNLIAVLITNFS